MDRVTIAQSCIPSSVCLRIGIRWGCCGGVVCCGCVRRRFGRAATVGVVGVVAVEGPDQVSFCYGGVNKGGPWRLRRRNQGE